jgi:adenylate cyclase
MKSSLALLKQHVLPALVCFALAALLAQMDWLQRVENLTLDARTRLRAQFYPTVSRDDFALIGIDEPSLKQFGRWPWTRDNHANLLFLLGKVKPSVVAWDILFTEPSPDDEYLAKGVVASGAEVVLGAERADADIGVKPGDEAAKGWRLVPLPKVDGDRSLIPADPAVSIPTGQLGQVAHVGFTDTPPGPDGVRREAPLLVRIGDGVYPALSLLSLMQYWHATPDDVHVRLGDSITIENAFVRRKIPIDETGAYFINYRHPLSGFVTYGYFETFDHLLARFKEKKSVAIPQLTGRILLVGQVADGLSDFGPTPFSPLTPLVLVHANVIENVLNEDYAHRVVVWPIWLGGLAVTIASLVFFSNRKFREQVVFSLGVPTVYGLGATIAWVNFSGWLPIVWPVLGFASAQVFMLGRRVLAEQKAKEQIKGMFGTYISPELVKQMVDSGVSPQLGGHDEEITAYFSDIQSFSTFSEKLGSGPLVELMNEYLTACTDIVQAQGGTLDKYIGDAVVAMFGAPIPLPDHAFRACVATQLVHRQLGELRTKWQSEGEKWPEIVWKMQSRIGLNTGVCMIGNMGSRTRFNYTMMGDNVNLAARMESGAKAWGAYTMCTEITKLACEQHGGDRVVFRPLGRIVVKGRTRAVPIYEIVGLKEHVTERTRECVGIFDQALAKYYARDWEGALALFARSRELEFNVPGKTPGVVSNPSLVYLDITAHYRDEPPPENWDGVYVMKEK